MDYITSYQQELRKVSRGEIESLVGDLIFLNSGIAITDVKSRWERGKGVNGGIIGTYLWEDYRLYKQSINPLAGGNVDLFLHGDLAEGLTLRKTGKAEYQIFSTDEKYGKLGKQYGFEEFGLTEEQAIEFFDQLYVFAVETLLNRLWE